MAVVPRSNPTARRIRIMLRGRVSGALGHGDCPMDRGRVLLVRSELTGAREKALIYSRQPYNHRRTAMRSRHGILSFAGGRVLVPGSVHAQTVTPQGCNAKRESESGRI